MGGYEALDAAAPVAVDVGRTAGQHDFEDIQEMFGDLEVRGVACVVEGDQHLIGQPSCVPRETVWGASFADIVRCRYEMFIILLSYRVQDTPHISECVN